MPDKKIYVLIASSKFPVYHPRAGEETHFIPSILKEQKFHTLRNNYDLWKKRIDKVNRGEAIVSLRTWNGKPYVDKQIKIKKYSKMKIQKIDFTDLGIFIDGVKQELELEEIASNDGLTLDDFIAWFKGEPKGTYAILHFTRFEY